MAGSAAAAQPHKAKAADVVASPIERDLLEIDVPHLQELYRARKYSVTQVVHWYLARIRQYNGVYGAIEDIDAKGALETAR